MSEIQVLDKPVGQVTAKQMAGWLRHFMEPGQVTELRGLRAKFKGVFRPETVSGFFDYDHVEFMSEIALQITPCASGVYFIPNPLNPELLARRNNRWGDAYRGMQATDADVIRRKWVLIDSDPVRLAGVSSTDEEKAKAREVIERAREYLNTKGFSEPIFADSGNGYHLLYRVDLPNDERSTDLVKRLLHEVANRCDTDGAKIDRTVFNSGRIIKLYGTMSRKGDSVPTRPHRRSIVLSIPGASFHLDQ